jgi:hypothetical protein
MSEYERQTEVPATPTAPTTPATEAGANSEDRRGFSATAHTPTEGQTLSEVEAFKIKCLSSALYHDDRERFFATTNRVLLFFVVLFGTAAVAPIRDHFWWVPALSAAAGLVNLVFDVNGVARLHASLRQRLYTLLSDVEFGEDCKTLEKRLILIYADESPIMYAVNAVAYNNAMLSLGRPEKYLIRVGAAARLFRHFWAFTPNSFKTRENLSLA